MIYVNSITVNSSNKTMTVGESKFFSATVGTTISPGVGTAIGTVFGLLAGIAYDIWGRPALDDLLE